ncbi:MAG: sialidase family protein [Dehalococcoidia bacterium]
MKPARHFFSALLLSVCAGSVALSYEFEPTEVEHGIVVADTTGEWSYMFPANNGMWSWGAEVVVHFQKHTWPGEDIGGIAHERVEGASQGIVQARSKDNGETWTMEGAYKDRVTEPATYPIDFSHDDFAMKAVGSSFYVSYDRAQTWQGPYEDFAEGQNRPDRVFHNGPDTAVTNVTRREGRKTPVTMRATDGGRTWTPGEPWPEYPGDDGGGGIAIQTNTVRLGEAELLAVGRSGGGGALYRSTDFGQTWTFERHVHPEGYSKRWVPSRLVVLGGMYPQNTDTNHVIAAWGARSDMEGPDGEEIEPGPRVRYSRDGGRTWSDNVVQLRNDVQDGVYRDIGYMQACLRTDGKVLLVYYFQTNEHNQPHIAWTAFDPNIEPTADSGADDTAEREAQ